ncbi:MULTISPECIES: substrate-binding domain-containing protein [Micromonospora]|uniref:Amino acid ABC transporter substrate-binding protein n=1 Tax=Micromonospora solifontis TaxID=2487138 RepID=A0ABX9WMD9_9ACTN|nr:MULTISPECIES: substrate-binding domain-containing protein [Micromonospora]NES12526.1 ABC transporter substrate-binding protein [Micromonospora sp. PPF5-17B]NES36029.1 ABC transporter substrate-binding protein [Micromonospora solifontis]NES54589.1 ABC transporter substrate-binding protein [Micromonospora sp. PPF5-6]RNL99955.1 amino acid ABC transporter substrate-binding protein [Micromonospora solifontis]
MTIRHTRRVFLSAATVMAAALAATACGSPQDTASGGGDAAPVKVGLVYAQSGPLASYGKEYIEGLRAGLDYATKGTGKVGNRKIEITEVDDAGDPAKAVSAAKDLIGKGYKIIGGSSSSGVALQVAPIAAQNKVLFISGPAATDAITGVNKYTFRSGRQSYQDVVTAKSFIGDAKGKKVVVFAQEGAFGDANEAAVKNVIGGAGATVTGIRAPASATEFTPFASQIKAAKPDLLFVAWAGTTAPAMWQTLDQQGVLASTTVVTGLDLRASWPTFGAAGGKISFLAHYFDGASDNDAAKAAKAKLPGGVIDLFHPDGFAAAQMIVRAAQEGGDDVDKMIKALEGWQFDSVKGQMTIRAEDHALLQPMYQAKLSGSGTAYTATAQKTLTGDETAPPVTQMKG